MATLDVRASNIIKYLAESLGSRYHGLSSMTMSIYDTAWVAMVVKTEKQGDQTIARWLYPTCFQKLLESQSPNGGFGGNIAEVDGILNTMAAVLALVKLDTSPTISGVADVPDLPARVSRGCVYLQEKLQTWDVHSTIHVGFEILIPSLLHLLQKEGMRFEFPGLETLMEINEQKLSGFSQDILYFPQQTTLLHSLEAFIGKIDFNKTAHHLQHGAMMASPSSTAAYLMHSSGWSEEAEAYLSFVVDTKNGAIPSAFPITLFEITWVLSTLLESNFTVEQLGEDNIREIGNFLESQEMNGSVVTGFAPGVLPDADDTAKFILTLSLLKRPTTCDHMIKAFETQTHFKTYNNESTESFSANCNVLRAIVRSTRLSHYLPQVIKSLNFLCQTWYKGKLSDKWNLDFQYSMMLLSEALMQVVQAWDNNLLAGLPLELIAECIPLVTLQILIRTLSTQSTNGSWKNSPEITAYAILTLKRLVHLPWISTVLSPIARESIDRGVKYLEVNEAKWDTPEFVWVEKVTYGSHVLSETYCLAALQASSSHEWREKASSLFIMPTKKVNRFTLFFSQLPLFSQEPAWRLRASIIEGCMLAPIISSSRPELQIFPSQDGESAKYLDYIPFTWTMCNNATGFGLSIKALHEMMIISVLNFRVDRYLEDLTGNHNLRGHFDSLRTVIRRIFADTPTHTSRIGHSDGRDESLVGGDGEQSELLSRCSQKIENCNDAAPRNSDKSYPTELLQGAKQVLSRFVTYILRHDNVVTAHKAVQRCVREELLIFLLAHITHGEDNAHLLKLCSQDGMHIFTQAQTSYYRWVHTTSADHTSCPYSFEFFRCLVASRGTDLFPSTLTGYLAHDVCRHLAVMCRQYNDYGSIRRDRAENNTNSVNFREFHDADASWYLRDRHEILAERCVNGYIQSSPQPQSALEDALRKKLFDIASYERECLNNAVRCLRVKVAPQAWKAIEVFIKVTDLYGQIYVMRDINDNSEAA